MYEWIIQNFRMKFKMFFNRFLLDSFKIISLIQSQKNKFEKSHKVKGGKLFEFI